MALAIIRDLPETRVPAGPEELAAFEADVLAGFVPAGCGGLSDRTVSSDVIHLQQIRAWFGRPGPSPAGPKGSASGLAPRYPVPKKADKNDETDTSADR